MSNLSDSATENVALLIFCKRPKLKQGKQRIAETLGAKAAFDIAERLLACALEDAQNWPGPVVLSPASVEDVGWAQGLLKHSKVSVIAQPEGNLGERINAIDLELRQRGHNSIVTIGTDAPILNSHFYTQVLSRLKDSDIVLSAAEDGGVTMMASSVAWPDIKNLPWSTDRLGQSLNDLCVEAGLSVEFIDPSYDIDLEGDLVKLMADLKDDRRPARQKLLNCVLEIVDDRQKLVQAGVE